MKNKKVTKVVLSVLTSMSMLSSYSAMVFAGNTNQGTTSQVTHEHDLVKLNRNNDLIINGGFDNNGSSWRKSGTGTFENDNGNYYGKLPSNSNNAAVFQNVSFKKNTDYVVRAKVKISNGKGQVFLAVKDNDLSAGLKDINGNAIETTISSSEDKAGQYQDVEFTFNSGDNTSGSIAFIKWTETNGNQDIINEEVWVDDVSVKAKNEATEDDNYEMVWADDFNKTELDTSKWDYELGSIRGVEQEHYVNDPENVYVKDGQLVLQVTNRDKEDQYKNPRGNRQVIYNSGSIRTHGKQEFLYGRIEMKAKLPKGKGAFPAFWTLGSDFTLDGRISSEQGAPWPVCGEIDIMEMIGAADGDAGGNSNRKVYQTLHAGSVADVDHSKSVSTYTLPEGIFNDDYHIFGVDWSKNKLEFYVDDKIVGSFDYGDNEEYKRCFNRPQYIQLNLATGGNWAGDAGNDLAGQKYEVDYVYYGQNAQQKADSEEYYKNAIKISGEHDVTMTEGEMPNLLEGVTSDQDSILDYSIDNEYSFKTKGGLTSVNLVCSGKNDKQSLKKLRPGKYNLYYTARSSTDSTKPATRRTVILTVLPNGKQDLIELDRELIKNGSFEDGDNPSTGYQISSRTSWDVTNAQFTKYPGCASEGDWCGFLPENSGNANIYQFVNLKKNTKYKLKAKVQLTEVGQTMFVNLKKNAQNLVNGNEVTVKCTEENKGQYQDVELNIDTGNEESIFGNANTANLTVCFMKWTESTSDATYRGKVFVDDVSLTEVRNEDDNYNLVWADEFNETELDKNNWGYELGHIRGLEQQHYTNSKDNVYLEDGNLVIKATNRKTEDQYEVTQGDTTRKVIYDSGSVRTHGKQEFLYGRIEMKAKLPKGQAVFPAFWTLGSDFHLDGNIAQGIGWPDSGEIDIMELIGNGTAGGVNGNRQVYQTLHYGTNGEDDGKYAGHGTCYTLPSGIFNDDYHVFGINWSKGKIEWYVDDQIVRTVDYSDDQRALECIDRPQYIEFNLALGGAWPGAAGENLAGTKYEVDYVRYARNEQQQKDADTFYANAYKINGEKDVTMTEGETPDLLAGITSDKESIVDYSINDEPMFTNVGGNTHVSLLCTGKNDTESLKSLKPGSYNLYYTAYKEGDTVSARTRRQVSLTVEERTFEKDLAKSQLELNGAIGSTLETIKLPAGWEFLNPKDKISEESQEVDVIYPAIGGKVGKAIINGYEKAVIVSGENTKLEYNASKPLEITINVSARNIQKVLVDGKEIDTKYYTIENISRAVNGNSKVVLTNEYLKTLSSGEHKVEIQTTAGNVDTIFTVVKSNSGKDDNENPNPGTGKDDNEKPNPGTGSDDNQKPNTGTENKDSQTNVDNKKNESVEGVSNTNKKTTKNAQTTTQKSTKTGDQAPVEIFIGCCLVSFIAIIALKKKKALK